MTIGERRTRFVRDRLDPARVLECTDEWKHQEDLGRPAWFTIRVREVSPDDVPTGIEVGDF